MFGPDFVLQLKLQLIWFDEDKSLVIFNNKI